VRELAIVSRDIGRRSAHVKTDDGRWVGLVEAGSSVTDNTSSRTGQNSPQTGEYSSVDKTTIRLHELQHARSEIGEALLEPGISRKDADSYRAHPVRYRFSSGVKYASAVAEWPLGTIRTIGDKRLDNETWLKPISRASSPTAAS
jgi:hypothetical protein